MLKPFKINQQQLGVILIAVEHGFKACERGWTLDKAKQSVLELYEVEEKQEG